MIKIKDTKDASKKVFFTTKVDPEIIRQIHVYCWNVKPRLFVHQFTDQAFRNLLKEIKK